MRMIGVVLLALLVMGSLMAGCDQHLTTDRPNIIFILTDDQRFDSLGYAGNDIIHTPEMDKLAQEGVYFENALVTTPICSASRASIFSGRYERAHRYKFGPDPLRPEFVEDSYPKLLKEAGYYSGFIGKFGVKIPESEALFDEFDSFYVDDEPDRPGYYNVEKTLDGETVHLTRYAGHWTRREVKNGRERIEIRDRLFFSSQRRPSLSKCDCSRFLWDI